MTARATITSPAALQCRICGQQYPVEPLTICEDCFGPLEPAYDLQSVDGVDWQCPGSGEASWKVCADTQRAGQAPHGDDG